MTTINTTKWIELRAGKLSTSGPVTRDTFRSWKHGTAFNLFCSRGLIWTRFRFLPKLSELAQDFVHVKAQAKVAAIVEQLLG